MSSSTAMGSFTAMGKVFGIGLSRTGTKSLTYALHQLGIHIAHFPDDPVTFQELSTGNYRFSLLHELDGIADITVSSLYPQLDLLFPGSKFILTVRNQSDWLRSLEKHWAAYPCFNDPNRQLPADRFHMATRQLLCKTVYGRYDFDREQAINVYNQHLCDVKSYFANRPDDLLILDICAGSFYTEQIWKTICCFLGKPLLHRPFPKVQEKSELTSLVQTDEAATANEKKSPLLI